MSTLGSLIRYTVPFGTDTKGIHIMTQLELDLIPHEVENTLINQRASDGYVNATAMCKAVGKQFNDYSRQKSTQEFIGELSSATGIPVAKLIQSVMGGITEKQGTWVHPDIAIHLGQWCSPKFAVAVSQWVREWTLGKSKPQKMPYHIERYMANSQAIPVTHFSMLNEMIFALIAPLESSGYTVPDNMVPDISEGRMFCKWLREVMLVDTDSLPTYEHKFEDGRVVHPKLYPNELLPAFREHFHRVWLPQKAENYFSSKDTTALPHLKRILALPQK